MDESDELLQVGMKFDPTDPNALGILVSDILEVIERLNNTNTLSTKTILEWRLYLVRVKNIILNRLLKDWVENGCVNYDLLNRINKCDSILRWLHHEEE